MRESCGQFKSSNKNIKAYVALKNKINGCFFVEFGEQLKCKFIVFNVKKISKVEIHRVTQFLIYAFCNRFQKNASNKILKE